MSIIKTFDPSKESILDPGHLAKRVDNFPERIICTFTGYMLDTFMGHHTCDAIGKMSDGRKIYKTIYKGKPIAFFCGSIGAPATVIFLEEAIVKGASKILLFGSCGILDEGAIAGIADIIIPTHAYRDEGTSYHYAPPEAGEFIEVKTSSRTAEIFKELNIPAVTGKVWTTDAIFRETRRNMELRKKAGCIIVDMECAGVMAMAGFRHIDVYQFMYAADNLDSDNWQKRKLGTLSTEEKKRYVEIALEVALRI